MRAEISLSKEEDKLCLGIALANHKQHKDCRPDPIGPGEGDHRTLKSRVQTVRWDKAEQDPVPGLLTAESPTLKGDDFKLQPGPSTHIIGWVDQTTKRSQWRTHQDYEKWDIKHLEGSYTELTNFSLYPHWKLLAIKLKGNRSRTRFQLWWCRQGT